MSWSLLISIKYLPVLTKSKYDSYILVAAAIFGPGNAANGEKYRRHIIVVRYFNKLKITTADTRSLASVFSSTAESIVILGEYAR
jgi:hypothetical protein